jgi:hypothetical protein
MIRCRIFALMLCFLCLSLAVVLAGCPQGPGIGTIGWVYNGAGGQTGFRIFENEDGDVIAVGEARGSNREEGTVYVRFGAGGSILADRIIFDLRNPSGIPTPTATLLSNGDVLLAATTAQGNINDNRLRVLRIDPDGNTLWDFTFGDVKLAPKLAVENDAGDILVAGNRTGSPPNVFFLLLAADGNISQFNELAALDDRSNLTGPRDGEWIGDAFVVTGAYPTEISRDRYGIAISVMRLDRNANILSWTRTVGFYPEPIGIEPLGGNLAILTSSSLAVDLITTDAEGNFLSISDNLFVPANPDERSGANDFIVDSSGDIVMVGEGTTVRYIGNFFPQITIRPFIAKFTSDGDRIWERTINARGVIVNGLTETADGGYATTGAAPGPNGDVLLNVIRFDRNGNIIN